MRVRNVLIAASLLALASVLWMDIRSYKGSPSSATIDTVANLRYGDGPGKIGKSSAWEHKGGNWRMMRIAASCAIDDNGRIYIIDLKNRLTIVSPSGGIIHQIECAWTKLPYQLVVGPKQTLWIADNFRYGGKTRLVKASANGAALWEIGRDDDEAKRVAPNITRPPEYSGNEDEFVQVEALFTSKNGDVFVYDNYKAMRRFDSNGRFIISYDVKSRDAWPKDVDMKDAAPVSSAIATRDGSVYSHSLGIMKNDRLITLVLNQWPRSRQRIRRMVDLTQLGHINSGDILLMGSDADNNLYFQYRYPTKEDRWSKSWAGPMAIAKVGSDNKAIKVFDIYDHYKDAMIGVGDLIHVSPKGDLYIEMQTSTHYRIDKISFAQK